MAKLTVSVSSCHDLPPCYVCLGASLVAQVGRTQLSDFAFTFHFAALEKEVATHSSVLAWRIPGMGESGGLPSMGLHRVRRLK